MPAPTTPPSMTPVPTPAPVRNDQNTFSSRVDALVTWLVTFVTELVAALSNCYNNAVSAYNSAADALTYKNAAAASETNSAASAAASAASAVTALNAPGTSATSTTSMELSPGSKSLTIQTGKNLVYGMPVNIAYTTTPTIYMHGIITAYNSGTGALDVMVSRVDGSTATYANWTVSLVGNAGTDGANGRQYINSAETLVAGITYDADSTGGAFTATMPANPAIGDSVGLIDPFGTWGVTGKAVTLARNGSNFVNSSGAGVAENFTLNISSVNPTFIYTSTGWRAI